MVIVQYDIVLVDLNIGDHKGIAGAEMRKTGPCVVISPNEMNRHLGIVVIAPMTTRPRAYPTRVKVKHDQRNGWIVVDQIMTVDRKRVISRIGSLSNPEIRNLKEAIRETYVE